MTFAIANVVSQLRFWPAELDENELLRTEELAVARYWRSQQENNPRW